MIGLDTNILVRYLAQDDEVQLSAVLALLLKKGAVFFVPDMVMVEVDWVLSSVYQWTPDEVADAFASLLTVQNLHFEDESRLRSCLRAIRQGADLSDELIMHVCRDQGCRTVATFDKAMAKRHPRMAVIPK